MAWDGVTAQLVGPASASIVLYDGHPAGELPFYPTWSPDGARIAIGDLHRIRLVDSATGSILSTLNFSSTVYPNDLQWSCTGSRIAFGTGSMYTVNVDAGAASLAVIPVASSGGARHPTWSPDDSTIAFANLNSTNKSKWNVVRMALSTTTPTVLVSGQATGSDLRWSKPVWRRF
jgi:Tol biopolymer transport system component